MDIKRGDRVLFSKYAGTEVELDGDEHLIVREYDVLAVLQ
jgi:chaperonin GroES